MWEGTLVEETGRIFREFKRCDMELKKIEGTKHNMESNLSDINFRITE